MQKNTLYAVLGLSPQILTETLYALIHLDEPFIPDEIHVLTTSKGYDICKLAFFKENGGWFHRFCKDYQLPTIKFDLDHIHIIENETVLDDIRSHSDNSAVANQITQHIREFTQNPNSCLHVSIAGGRKTMGFYAGYALSMFGRSQDRLSHVLVESRYEGHPNFFYPTPYTDIIRSRDGQEIYDVSQAKIELAFLPFITMRSALPTRFLDEETSFEEMVNYLQKRVFSPRLIISTKDCSLQIGEDIVKLTPANFVFYYWLTKRIKEGKANIELPFENEPNAEYADEYRLCIHEALREIVDMDRTLLALENGMDKDFIRDRKTQIKRALTAVLGVNHEHFIVHRHKRQQILKLNAEQISYV
ncbi:MAG: TIGR02584 family CRISPR-associated protein [Thiotrichales bacterium]|nr:TIGR02584 family CRISPR-associated protein [Thiotrichales bacterium]